jgi:isoquinoline 1-oxidoreductase beta subunit
MGSMFNPRRRDFLISSAAAGGGLVIGFRLPAARGADGGAKGAAREINAWIAINADDTVVIRVARSEMGQGSLTGLPMLVAEELECDWKKVRTEYVSPNENVRRKRMWGDMNSTGSQAIRGSQLYLRRAGATAREMLIAAAAQQWGVPASECVAAASMISHVPSARKVSYGAVAAAAAKLAPPENVKLKDSNEWRLLGTPVKRFDIPDTVMGRQIYGVDIQLPGMVHAAIAQCPVFGGRPRKVDADAVKGMRGVLQVVTLDDAVAVVADNWWRAHQALKKLPVEWDDGGNGQASTASITEFVRSGLDDPGAPVARNDGDVDSAFAGAARVVEADYFAPFLAHATMEPMNCTAWVRDGRVDVWAPTQNALATLAAAAEAAGVPVANVEAHKMQVGGGFGRRGFQDYTRQAVKVAQAVGRPVKLLWSREEDMQHDFYRPMTMVRFKGGVDAAGNFAAWKIRDSSHSIMAQVRPENIKGGVDRHALGGLVDMPYSVPNLRVEFAMRNSHVPVGFWRTVFQTQNPFFRECFVDEMAHAAGKDPVVFRRAMLQSQRAKRDLGVLDAVARAAGWGKPLPAGVHRGIAVHDSHGSHGAAVFEVSVKGNDLRIHRVVVAVDPGYVVNPDSAVAQVQSCVVYGVTAALWGEITVKNGRVEQSNFHDYPMMLIRHMPKVEAVLVPSGGFWGGMGETPLAPLAPALCNAIFSATGKRVRALPLKNSGYRLV